MLSRIRYRLNVLISKVPHACVLFSDSRPIPLRIISASMRMIASSALSFGKNLFGASSRAFLIKTTGDRRSCKLHPQDLPTFRPCHHIRLFVNKKGQRIQSSDQVFLGGPSRTHDFRCAEINVLALTRSDRRPTKCPLGISLDGLRPHRFESSDRPDKKAPRRRDACEQVVGPAGLEPATKGL